MRIELGDGYALDDDPARLDVGAVWRYLAEESYWARGRSRDLVAGSIATSFRSIGLYHGSALVGFARVVSDGLTVAYLCDVFVLPEHRGRGLGVALLREAVDGAGLRGVKWLLHTDDAHHLYRRLGFGPPDDRAMERRPD